MALLHGPNGGESLYSQTEYKSGGASKKIGERMVFEFGPC